MEPFLVELRGTSDDQVRNSPRSLDDPVSTVSTSGAHHALVEPVVVCPPGMAFGPDGEITTPYLVQVNHQGGNRARSLETPLPTVCGNRGEWALITPEPHPDPDPEAIKPLPPAILPQGGGGALRSVDDPAPTVACDGAIALVEPFLIEYYGTGTAQSVSDPLNTVTTKDRHALVRPVVVINGEQYLLDIRFRMLQPHELAAAQGFLPGYKFTGTKSDQVKQIGNAVPRRLARALVTAALSQNPDVSWLE